MKFIATADWHLGNLFHGNDRLAEHRHFFGWLADLISEEKPDALLVAGDIFDNGNPSAASQSLYYTFIDSITGRFPELTVVITAGNHDSATRLEAPRPIMSRHGVHIRGTLGITHTRDGEGTLTRSVDYDDLMIPVGDPDDPEAVILAVPYLRADSVRGGNYAAGVREMLESVTRHARRRYPDTLLIMMSHLYAGGAEIASGSSERIIVGGEEQVEIGSWSAERPDYMVCGHIHRRQGVRGASWARYPGSVLPMSFAERHYTHGVDVVTIGPERIPTVRQMRYEPTHPLVMIPEEGEKCNLTPRQLKRLIESQLPPCEGESPDENAPYVALRVHTSRINADTRHEIEALTASRNAILCKTETVSDTVIVTMDGTEQIHTVGDILNRPVIDTLSEAYRLKNGEELTDRRRTLLTDLLATLGPDME